MKSFLIIGMGRFGSHLCRNLAKLGNEVMIIDQNEELLEPLLPYVTDAKIGDCTKEEMYCLRRHKFSEQSGNHLSAKRTWCKIRGQQSYQRCTCKISAAKRC